MLPLLTAVAAGLVVSLFALSLRRDQVLGRISLRNVIRRQASTALVVLGSMVGTAMIAGSLALGDSFQRTAHAEVFTRLGEIDHVVTFSREGQSVYFPRADALAHADADALNALTVDRHGEELVDGVLPVVQEIAPVSKLDAGGETALIRPQVAFVAVDPGAVASFGEQPPTLPRFEPGEVVVSHSFADELRLAVGDRLAVSVRDGGQTFVVAAIVPDEGLTGYRPAPPGTAGVVGPIIAHIDDGRTLFAGREDLVNALLISNRGGVLAGVEPTGDVRQAIGIALRDLVPGGALHAEPVKERLIEGSSFIGVAFAVFSVFAIAAGIMLLVTIYTMLAQERRTEMGTLRAIAARRGHLVRLYTYEGFVYSLIATVVGIAAGLGAAVAGIWALDRVARGTWILPEGFALALEVRPTTLLVAGAIGLFIAMATVVATSLRVSRVNIVSAIRDLPDPPRGRRRTVRLVVPVGLVAVGAAMTVAAVSAEEGHLYLLGPVALALGIGAVLQHVLPARLVLTPILLGVAVYSQMSLSIAAVQDALDQGPAVMILSGLLLVIAGIGIVALNLSAVLSVVRRVETRTRRLLPVLRVAIAYPAERPGRTGLVLGMFAIIIYAVTLVATIGAVPRHHVDGLAETMVGGYDAIVTTLSGNPLDPDRLAASPAVRDGRVAAVSPVRSYEVELPGYRRGDYLHDHEHGSGDPEGAFRGAVNLFDTSFLRNTRSRLAARAVGYDSDAETWAALADDPSLVIVDFRYSGDASWDPHPPLAPGDTIDVRDPLTGNVLERTVIGRTADEPISGPLHGIMMSAAALPKLNRSAAELPPTAYLIDFDGAEDHRGVALDLEHDLVTHGAQVHVVADEVAREVGGMLGFMRIWQGFLAFGLIVGVAGLAVVSARNVHQRHHEIGTLRALGLQRRMVTAVFLAESSLVAGLGVLLGVVAGSVSGWFLVQEMWSTADLSFVWPAGEIGLLAGTVLLASLISTALPARRAAALTPVEALRPRE